MPALDTWLREKNIGLSLVIFFKKKKDPVKIKDAEALKTISKTSLIIKMVLY